MAFCFCPDQTWGFHIEKLDINGPPFTVGNIDCSIIQPIYVVLRAQGIPIYCIFSHLGVVCLVGH